MFYCDYRVMLIALFCFNEVKLWLTGESTLGVTALHSLHLLIKTYPELWEKRLFQHSPSVLYFLSVVFSWCLLCLNLTRLTIFCSFLFHNRSRVTRLLTKSNRNIVFKCQRINVILVLSFAYILLHISCCKWNKSLKLIWICSPQAAALL